MAAYGYVVHTFRVHKWGKRDEAGPLGNFDGHGADALPYLYGALRGLTQSGVNDRNRHLRVKAVEGVGRTARFTVEIGQSGQTSQFFDSIDGTQPVFERNDRHIETGLRRALIVAPTGSTNGLLVTEVQGRSGARTLLAPALSRIFKFHTEHILDIASVVDETALEQFIAEAQAHTITLRKSGLPTDIAEMVEIQSKDAPSGKLELRITPGNKVRQFQKSVVARLRGDDGSRRQLLQVHGLNFDELSVGMTVGDRRTTLTVTADRVPTFVYDLPGRTPVTDDAFYADAKATVREIASAVGVHLGQGWQTGKWSAKATRNLLTVPEEANDGPATVGAE